MARILEIEVGVVGHPLAMGMNIESDVVLLAKEPHEVSADDNARNVQAVQDGMHVALEIAIGQDDHGRRLRSPPICRFSNSGARWRHSTWA